MKRKRGVFPTSVSSVLDFWGFDGDASNEEHPTEHVKVLLKPNVQSTEHRNLAATTGSFGTDDKREKPWRLFLCTDIFLFFTYDTITGLWTWVSSSKRPTCLLERHTFRLEPDQSAILKCVERIDALGFNGLKWKGVRFDDILCSSGYNNTHCLWRSIVSVQ